MFQSTHPHGVRHLAQKRADLGLTVSIHAPAWGATELQSLLAPEVSVSIHAPAWGATPEQD